MNSAKLQSQQRQRQIGEQVVRVAALTIACTGLWTGERIAGGKSRERTGVRVAGGITVEI
jgi:hypothetical protein